MTIARITTVEWNSKETCDTREQDYVNNAPQEFPDASQLLFMRLDETTVMAVTLYPDEQTMQNADEARAKRLAQNFAMNFTHVVQLTPATPKQPINEAEVGIIKLVSPSPN